MGLGVQLRANGDLAQIRGPRVQGSSGVHCTRLRGGIMTREMSILLFLGHCWISGTKCDSPLLRTYKIMKPDQEPEVNAALMYVGRTVPGPSRPFARCCQKFLVHSRVLKRGFISSIPTGLCTPRSNCELSIRRH